MRAAKELTRSRAIAVVLPAAEELPPSSLARVAAGQRSRPRSPRDSCSARYQFDRYRTQPVTPGWHRPATEVVRVLTDDGSTTAVAEGLRRGQRPG